MLIPTSVVSQFGTFRVPKKVIEDPGSTLLDLYNWNEVHNAEFPLFRFYDGKHVKTISWSEAGKAIHRAAAFFESRVGANPEDPQPVVVLLATTDTITYFCSIVGVLHAGFAVFPVSFRNNEEAVTNLLARTGAKYVFTSNEPHILSLVNTAINADEPVQSYIMPKYEDLFPFHSDADLPSYRRRICTLDDSAIIFHSSGSTGLPKALICTYRGLQQWPLIPWYSEINLTGVVMGCHALPMFHGLGILQIGTAASCGIVVSTFKPISPAIFPTPANVFEESKATASDMICCIPAFIELWAADSAKVEHMKTLKGLIFGGAPLNKPIGDHLAAKGVCLYTSYGTSEVGVISTLFPANPGLDWEYISFSEQLRPEFVSYNDGTYELVLVERDGWIPMSINTHVDGHNAFATKDLFVPHETKAGLWKIYGRADDQIILSTGEKTNPGPLESVLARNPHIQSAVIFGRGRFQNGLLVDPKTQNQEEAEKLRDLIWPTVEHVNSVAPQHSRIFREMIIFSSPSKPFTYTAKGTARRQVVIDDYAREIEALYNATTTGRSEVVAPSDWSDGQTLNFVREVVKTALRRDVEDEVDIFQYGCDSLQATWILNQITGAIRASNISDSINLPSTSVYQASSISQLSRLVVESIQNSTSSLQSRTRGIMTQQLHSLVVKYTQGFPQRPAILRDPAEAGDVVLATGTTGGLGCHILVQLLLDDAVKAVYAFNRPSGDLRRHEEIFRRNGLDVKWLRSPKLYLVEGTLTEPALGLDNPTYEKIRDTITHVIHNAWKVSFNQSVTSFEGLLWGVRALVDLCISSPHKQCPHFLFTSSMGVFRTPKTSDPMLEEPIDDVSIVVGIGYSESKWIAEGILSSASQKRGLPTTCVRVGQLCGGASGYWNEKEYFPALVKSSLYAGCLPDVAGTVSWIPSNDAALALVQMRGSHEPILHLAHPRPVAWKTFLQRIAERMQVPLVSYDVWLGALERSKSQSQELELDLLRQNPALRLLEFFRNVERGGDREPLGAVRMDLTKAMREAPSIDLPELDSTWAERWIDGWQKAGYIPRTDGMGRTAIGNTSRL